MSQTPLHISTCLDYIYSLDHTSGCTGFVSCLPTPEPSLGEALELLADRPRDSFLRQFLLQKLSTLDMAEVTAFALAGCMQPKILGSLASILLEFGQGAGKNIYGEAIPALARMERDNGALFQEAATPESPPDENRWRSFFRANIHAHRRQEADMPPLACLYPEDAITAQQEILEHHRGLLAEEKAGMPTIQPEEPIDPKITHARALEALTKANLLVGPEMRHEASLSPIALLREWRLELKVKNGNIDHSLSGTATAYGRGLSLAGARAACLMEIVERASAHVSIEHGGKWGHGRVLGRAKDLSLRLASHEWLTQKGIMALDPTDLGGNSESPRNFLHWVEGKDPAGQPVLVPAQAVFLFCNLDENDCISTSSTGLASGNSMAQARLAALCEILERDAHATTPFIEADCFRLASRDPRINSLLLDYRARNIHIRFQDISREDGFPVYRCFVQSREGDVAQSTGAGLNGQKAILSALTETPWPYVWAKPAPFGKATSRAMEDVPVRFLEDLPDFSLPSTKASLTLLENTLSRQGITPVYVDLTRSDLDLPVTRALIPRALADTDCIMFPSPRLPARWLRAQNNL